MQKFPTMEQLTRMPLNKIRNLDIRSKEEEQMVQIAVNVKAPLEPQSRPVPIRIPDIKTGDQEKYWQEKVNAYREANKPKPVDIDLSDGLVDDVSQVDTKLQDVVEVKEVKTKRFCEFCTSKGVRHKKECTRPK